LTGEDRLVRPLMVIAIDEVVELGLLPEKVAVGWFSGFDFQGEVS
jgi:hypothetical protein